MLAGPGLTAPFRPMDQSLDTGAYLLRLLANQARSPFGAVQGSLPGPMPMWGQQQPLTQGPTIGRLPEGRPMVQNPDGTTSTHRNMIMGFDNEHLLVPSLYGGQQVTPEDAIAILRRAGWRDPDTGMAIPSFPTLPAAEAYEQQAHDELERLSRQRPAVPGMGR